jgi:hypothetical protein
MNRYLAALVFAVSLIACGPQTPVGTFVYTYTDPPPDMTPTYRLSVDEMGTISDSLMNGQACVWAHNRGCEKKCFPTEMMWSVCDGDNVEYLYTRQGLTKEFGFGRKTVVIADPSCKGEWTFSLVKLDVVTEAEKQNMQAVHDCKNPRQDLSSILFDRQWYRHKPADILPASEVDLPKKPPTQ